MYIDKVLTKNLVPLFEGSPEETREWLKNNKTDETDVVCDGYKSKFMTVSDYLEAAKS